MRDARRSILEMGLECDKEMVKRAKLVLQHQSFIDAIRLRREDLLEAKIRHIEARSDINGLKERNASIMKLLDEQKENVRQATEETNENREVGKRLSIEVRDLLEEHEDKRELITRLSEGKSSEDMELEIEAEKAKLELIHAANPNVLRDFEARAQEIARLQKKMDGLAEKLARVTQELEKYRSKFEPKLDELVSKISDAFAYNFEQINCAGEVRVHKDEDFDLWALDIMVKFRYVLANLSALRIDH
jgi:chromosome segregation ATPase